MTHFENCFVVSEWTSQKKRNRRPDGEVREKDHF